jgi:preprotein translocase subunit SecE
MTEAVETEPGALDIAKLALGIVVAIAGLGAFYYLSDQSPAIRWLAVLAGLGIGAAIALQSYYGRRFGQFVQSARVELRKVVWPNRQETVQTTIVVFVFVVVSGVFFWLLDILLGWITKQLTGQGS